MFFFSAIGRNISLFSSTAIFAMLLICTLPLISRSGMVDTDSAPVLLNPTAAHEHALSGQTDHVRHQTLDACDYCLLVQHLLPKALASAQSKNDRRLLYVLYAITPIHLPHPDSHFLFLARAPPAMSPEHDFSSLIHGKKIHHANKTFFAPLRSSA